MNPLLGPVLKASEADNCRLPCQVSLGLVRTREQKLRGQKDFEVGRAPPQVPSAQGEWEELRLWSAWLHVLLVSLRPSGGWREVTPSIVQHVLEWCLARGGLLTPSSLSPLLCPPDTGWRCYLCLVLKPSSALLGSPLDDKR